MTPTLAAVLTVAMVVAGILIALIIALRDTDSCDRADVVRAVAELFRRGGPPGGLS